MKRKLGGYVVVAVVLLGIGAALAQTHTKTQMNTQTAAAGKMLSPTDLQWGPAPAGLPPSVQAAVLAGDPTQPGLYTVRLRVPDGGMIRPHWHSNDEHLTVISGRVGLGMGDTVTPAQMTTLAAGGYATMPAHHHHYAQSHGETILQLSGLGPFDIHYVNPTDDPRQQRSSR
jgi:mannose-6-phosphate isomerase-like protein (cupin superfamily)